MGHIAATLRQDSVNYRSLPCIKSTRLGQLRQGDAFEVLAYTFTTDPTYPMWCQIFIDNTTAWAAESLLSIPTIQIIKQLPYLGADVLHLPDDCASQLVADAARALCNLFGISLVEGEKLTFDSARARVAHLAAHGTQYFPSHTWRVADLTIAADIIDSLADYAVILLGKWSFQEMQVTMEAVRRTATHAQNHFLRLHPQSAIGQVSAFRLLYGPLAISRIQKEVLEEGIFARNRSGYLIELSNRVFYDGSGWIDPYTKRGKFSRLSLLIHEIAHTLNWRYLPNGKSLLQESGFRMAGQVKFSTGGTLQSVKLPDGYVGLIHHPRSSPQQPIEKEIEALTDVITNSILDTFTDDAYGDARRSQAKAIMQAAIKHRIAMPPRIAAGRRPSRGEQANYHGRAADHLARRDRDIRDKVAPALALLQVHEDTDLAAARASNRYYPREEP